MGIALAEAMAAGRAAVASRTGPIPELVRHGVDGWLVPPADPENLAEGICTLLADPERRESLGRSAAAATLARFSPTAAAERLAEIYKSVA
jgi:glycosyltransferase involved in cell wall biosynthesis